MTKQGWRELILKATVNNSQLNMLSELLVQVDETQQLLRDNGYSCIGMSLYDGVKNLIEAIKTNE